ncbi:hypothetical protein AYI70_g100 [Smittium culicis]|uniref:Velvet domain-containing protein n=1 Tax=Smittium culicis TaxID=133412 RepID=A0A1R1YHX7_9FUNG|nr:hypothetical protein AYI70_g100 [Smittium culicis]
MCGFGSKDRRTVSPTPILKLAIFDINGEKVDTNEFNDVEFIVSASLWSPDMSVPLDLASPNRSLDYDEISWLKSMVKNISGTNISNGVALEDTDGELFIFFIFNDLSVKKPGDYRLRFSLSKIPESDYYSNFEELDHIFSDVFTVFSAKNFPGVLPSSSLSKFFSQKSANKTFKGLK